MDEYGVDAVYETVNIYTARWIESDDIKKIEEIKKKIPDSIALDGGGYLAYLAPTRVNLSLTKERYPDIKFVATREL